MGDRPAKTLYYKRCRFVTQLPTDCLYSPDHFWLRQDPQGKWRVGLTKFATRLLGEMVEHGFSVELNDPVTAGQIIGWVEGFKAISDLLCVAAGKFAGSNPALKEDITLLNRDPFGAGWVYSVEGKPGAQCLPVQAYVAILDQTIDRLRKAQDSRR